MKKQASGAEGHSGVTQVVIKTSNQDGGNVINVFLKVTGDGEIAEMFGVDTKGKKWAVKQLKFRLNKKSEHDDNDECKCCTKDPVTGVIRCLPCPCEN